MQVGTGFLVTAESGASGAHKAALQSPAARTTILTRLFSGRPWRGILNELVRDLAWAEPDVPGYPVQNALMGPIRSAAYATADTQRASFWSGQAAGLTRPLPAAYYLAALVADAEAALSG